MKKVYIAHDSIDASMSRDILMNSGIEAIVLGESLYYMRGALPSSDTSPTVWVMDDGNYDEAVEILEAYSGKRKKKIVEIKTWICRKCGEEVDDTMDSCWNCGKEK